MPSDLFAFLQYEFQGVGIAAETAVDGRGFAEESFEQDEESGTQRGALRLILQPVSCIIISGV